MQEPEQNCAQIRILLHAMQLTSETMFRYSVRRLPLRDKVMYAIVRVCGKQYRVQENDMLRVSRIDGEAGTALTLAEVLAIGGAEDAAPQFGSPTISGASVAASIVGQGKGPKIDGYTYKAKKNVRHHYGHRQDITTLKIGAISLAAS